MLSGLTVVTKFVHKFLCGSVFVRGSDRYDYVGVGFFTGCSRVIEVALAQESGPDFRKVADVLEYRSDKGRNQEYNVKEKAVYI